MFNNSFFLTSVDIILQYILFVDSPISPILQFILHCGWLNIVGCSTHIFYPWLSLFRIFIRFTQNDILGTALPAAIGSLRDTNNRPMVTMAIFDAAPLPGKHSIDTTRASRTNTEQLFSITKILLAFFRLYNPIRKKLYN